MSNTNYINNLEIIESILGTSTNSEKIEIMKLVVNKNVELLNKKQLTV